MGQSSLNASHDVFMVRTMLFDPSSYLSEVHSFVGDLVLQGVLRGPRAERGQRAMCLRLGARVPPPASCQSMSAGMEFHGNSACELQLENGPRYHQRA